MSKVHLRLDGTWAVCRASKRACPRTFHLQDFTLRQVRELPPDFMLPLLNAIDPPAYEDEVGFQRWTDAEGETHRDHDLPAVVHEGGRMLEWWEHGRLHREGDKPASISPDGMHEWYWHGELHRDGDQPAAIFSSGTRHWYQDGVLHRDGGLPAVIESTGEKQYWVHGQPVEAPPEF